MKPNKKQNQPLAFLTIVLSLLLAATACTKKEKHDESLNEEVQVTSKELKPDDYFAEAIEAFANQEYKKSAGFIEQAAQSMKGIAELTTDNQQKEIANSIEELTDLASSVASDKVEGVNELNYFFARAGKALAGLHMHTTESYYFDLHGKQAGNELREALSLIEKTVQYHGRKLNGEEMQLMADGRQLAKQLEKGTVTKQDIERFLASLSNQIKNFDQELEIKFESIASKKKSEVHTQ